MAAVSPEIHASAASISVPEFRISIRCPSAHIGRHFCTPCADTMDPDGLEGRHVAVRRVSVQICADALARRSDMAPSGLSREQCPRDCQSAHTTTTTGAGYCERRSPSGKRPFVIRTTSTTARKRRRILLTTAHSSPPVLSVYTGAIRGFSVSQRRTDCAE